MARKRTAAELREEAKQKMEQAKVVEQQEDAELGRSVRKLADKLGLKVEELLAKMEQSTASPQQEPITDNENSPVE